jgi:hypothetical protein
MIRGCDNNKAALAENPILKQQNDSLRKKNIADSAEWAEKEKGYNTALDLVNGQLELKDNQISAKDDSLNDALVRINTLINEHHAIKVSPTDTNTISVPAPYVWNCEGCYKELQAGRDLVFRYKAEKDNLEQTYRSKISLQENRINELGQQNKVLQSSLTNEFSIAKTEEEKYAPRRIVYLSLSTLTWNGVLPKAVGAGLIYQDKHKRQVEIKAYGSNIGPIYETGIAVPLSLNRR